MPDPIPSFLDLSDYTIGPDGDGVRIYWGDIAYSPRVNIAIGFVDLYENLEFNGNTTTIGIYSEWFSSYDGSWHTLDTGIYNLILTNGNASP